MIATEAAGFPDVAQGPPQTLKVFLHIRNRLVCKCGGIDFLIHQCFIYFQLDKL
jgi:hypothetical protein